MDKGAWWCWYRYCFRMFEVLVKAYFCQIDDCMKFGTLTQMLCLGAVLFKVLVILWIQFQRLSASIRSMFGVLRL